MISLQLPGFSDILDPCVSYADVLWMSSSCVRYGSSQRQLLALISKQRDHMSKELRCMVVAENVQKIN